MPTNDGFYKEDVLIAHLHHQTFGKLPNNLKNLVRPLFGLVEDNDLILCSKVEGYIKPDFCIECQGKRKYVSMKTGSANILHQEDVGTFTTFLRQIGISQETVETILLYQYGDGTLDGSAAERIEYNELRVMLKDRIKRANKELNEDKEILKKVIRRCIYFGTQENAIPIDALYFGTVEFGYVATVRQLERHFKVHKWDWMENLHIGPLQLRPHARYYGKEIKNPKRRQRLEIYWANLGRDIEFISLRYDY